MRSQTLYNTTPPHNKQYTVTLEATAGVIKVIGFGGPIGGTQRPYPKYEGRDVAKAEKAYADLLKEKERGGYKPGADAAKMAPVDLSQASIPLDSPVTEYPPMLLNPITDPEPYIRSREWVMQAKEDGVRAVGHINSEVRAYSRTGLPVAITAGCAALLKKLFDGYIVDMEVIGEHVVVFDLLAGPGGPLHQPGKLVDLRGYSCADRLRALAAKFPIGSRRTGIVRMIHTAYTEKEKREMFKALHAEGAEGAVFKQAAAPYEAGRPSSGGPALKLKFKARATLKVIAIGADGKESVDVALRCGTRVAACSIIGKKVPKIGTLIEVEYLYAHRGGGLSQPVYTAIRTDKTEADTAESLQYKGEKR